MASRIPTRPVVTRAQTNAREENPVSFINAAKLNIDASILNLPKIDKAYAAIFREVEKNPEPSAPLHDMALSTLLSRLVNTELKTSDAWKNLGTITSKEKINTYRSDLNAYVNSTYFNEATKASFRTRHESAAH